MDERLRFVARLLEGEKMAPLCAEFGISRKTGYKIFNRYKDCGVQAFTDRSRRPIARRIGCRPSRGGDRAAEAGVSRVGRAEDSREVRQQFTGPHLPAISTVHAVLDRHGLVHRRRRRRPRATGTGLSQPTEPNVLWCADYKGEFMLANRRYCYPLTITDFASRYLLTCEALATTQEAMPSRCSSGRSRSSGCRGDPHGQRRPLRLRACALRTQQTVGLVAPPRVRMNASGPATRNRTGGTSGCTSP